MLLAFTKNALFQKHIRTAIYLAAGFTFPLATLAATPPTPPTLPSSVDAARVAQTLNPGITPKSATGPSTPKFTPQPISPGAQRITFKLNKLNIVGASVYGNEQIANSFQNYLGHVISLADLQQIADAITLKYRRDGYILSKAVIPAQQIKNGVVRIRIIEGYINNVDVKGDPKGARKLLEAYGDHIKEARPLNIKTLERYALLANDIPGMDVKTVISAAQPPANVMAPSDIAPGAANLTFIAAEHTANGFASYDNRGTKFLGPQQMSAGGSVNSIFRAGDQTSIQSMVTQHIKELQYISISHKTPLGTNGATLNLTTSYTKTNPGYTLKPFDIKGRSQFASAGVSYPILRERNQSLFLNTSFDYLNNRTDLDAFNTELYNDHIRSLRIGTTFDRADHWLGVNEITTQLSQGLEILGATKNGSILSSRPNGKSDYTKVNLNISRIQGLTHNFSVLAAVTGQYAFTPLLSAEQFSYGGSQFGQAYDPSEITGDHGLASKIELRYDMQTGWRELNNIQYFTFYDIGKIWNKDSSSGQIASASGASTGIGVRANFTKYFASTLELAKPLTRKVATMGNKDPRVFFSISLAGDTPSNATEIAPPSTPPAAKAVAPYTGLTPVQPTVNSTTASKQNLKSGISTNKHLTHSKEKTAESTPVTPDNAPQYEGLTAVNTAQ